MGTNGSPFRFVSTRASGIKNAKAGRCCWHPRGRALRAARDFPRRVSTCLPEVFMILLDSSDCALELDRVPQMCAWTQLVTIPLLGVRYRLAPGPDAQHTGRRFTVHSVFYQWRERGLCNCFYACHCPRWITLALLTLNSEEGTGRQTGKTRLVSCRRSQPPTIRKKNNKLTYLVPRIFLRVPYSSLSPANPRLAP